MAIYHIERTIIITEEYIETWEVEASSPEEAEDLVVATGTRLSSEHEGTEQVENMITNVYLVAD